MIVFDASARRKSFHLVYSLYVPWGERANWLEGWPHHLTIYSKGGLVPSPTPSAEVIECGERGSAAEKICRFIVEHYDSLAQVTLFLFPNCWKRPWNVLWPLELYNATPLGVRNIITTRSVIELSWPNRISHWGKWAMMLERGEIQRSPYSLGEFYDLIVGGQRPERLIYSPSDTFSVCRKHILRRPKSYWIELRDLFNVSYYPEEAHYIERMWNYVFGYGRKSLGIHSLGGTDGTTGD